MLDDVEIGRCGFWGDVVLGKLCGLGWYTVDNLVYKEDRWKAYLVLGFAGVLCCLTSPIVFLMHRGIVYLATSVFSWVISYKICACKNFNRCETALALLSSPHFGLWLH